MNVISTDEAMRHLRAEDDDRADVELYLAAAEDSAAQFMNRRFFADQTALDAAITDGAAGDRPILINPTIRAACLLIVGNLYGNREDVVVGTISSELPGGSRSLLTPYRIGWGV
ncbi:phage gp6-like head-tail connector protein [Pseudomonas proteolytica]|uniref:Phage gp6-like head-tail connector protein n=1 Tax=Pseudomonas proteolytica TaxID=219574 RepID=A0AAW5A7C2_9PSED|nr:head-tail connector protein [Pseudomonas proteolytica]MCF5056086.1 phage gp6-like head-tail connector protein [Pseudomonas proteolytica]MCF5103188.1 phage gp6-like head-tail connector protein [Pseudomonas proteolytica]